MKLPTEQQAIRDKCFHPSGRFVEFPTEDVETSIPERFDKIVRLYPDRIAVRSKTHTLSYRALDEYSNRIARAILAQSGAADEPVGLLFKSDVQMLAAILAVLKAGKIYVPLDPSLAKTRLEYISQDSQISLIVTNNQNRRLARHLGAGKLPSIDVDRLPAAQESANLGRSISPDALTWIFYTSGSTGQPKGVVQTHRNVLHQVMTYTNGLHLCADDRLTLLHSCSFSASRLEIFGALLNGASLFPYNAAEEGMSNLARWLVDEGITLFHWVPTPFRHFLDTLAGTETFPALRLIVLGSEILNIKDVELYQKQFAPDCLLVNRFGTTETGNIGWYFIDKQTRIRGAVVPVGYALPDTELLLLDDAGQEVGFNEVGEMSVRSRYLFPGYWRRRGLSEAKFRADPKGGDQRLYRTGDLGVMLDDGCLAHMGRKDFQVKLRGYRIEVGEIEAQLLNLDNVKEAVVILREDRPGDKHLVAYIVPARQPAPTITRLRRALAEKLPGYMVPSAFVPIDALPLLPNGKLDRQGLPRPALSRASLDTEFISPETSVERVLGKIWAEVLNVDQVGVRDSFFDLGGHSVTATQIISHVRKYFQVEIPLSVLLQSPTIAAMAAIITENRGKRAGDTELTQALREAEAMTEEDARRFVRENNSTSNNK